MGDVGNGAVGILVEGFDDAVHDLQLLDAGDVLAPDRIARCLDEVDHRRRNTEFEVVGGLAETGDLPDVFGAESSRESIERCDTLFAEQLLPGLRQVSSLV